MPSADIQPLLESLNGNMSYEDGEKAEPLSDTISKCFTMAQQVLPVGPTPIETTLACTLLREKDVYQTILSLPNKYSTGPDEIPYALLKICSATKPKGVNYNFSSPQSGKLYIVGKLSISNAKICNFSRIGQKIKILQLFKIFA